MSKEQIFNNALKIYDDYERLNTLILAENLINLISDEMGLCLNTDKETKHFNTLSTILMSLNEIINESESDLNV